MKKNTIKIIKKILFNNETLIRLAREMTNPKRFITNRIWIIGRKITRNSIFNRKSEMNMCSLLPEKILKEVISTFKPKSVLDIGCGVGRATDYFINNNINSIGIEGSSLAIKESLNPNSIIKYNLNTELDLNKKFDIVWSFEFVEHIHPKYTKNLIKTFSNHSDIIILSAARPGQGGEGHFNEQNDEYWINQFKKYNFILDFDNTNKLRHIDEQFAKNMYVFIRN